jgi:hypothetical protein
MAWLTGQVGTSDQVDHWCKMFPFEDALFNFFEQEMAKENILNATP